MAGNLRISWRAETDGSGELRVCFESKGFSGQSSAWFDLATLEKGIEHFSNYPLEAENPPIIQGGYWNRDATFLEQEHVYLSANPRGKAGDIVFLVRLVMPCEGPDDPGLRFSASGELQVSYEQLSEFVRGFYRLLNGLIDELALCEHS